MTFDAGDTFPKGQFVVIDEHGEFSVVCVGGMPRLQRQAYRAGPPRAFKFLRMPKLRLHRERR